MSELAPSDLALQPAMAPRVSNNLWPEPIDTPGYIPHHLKQSATSQFPVLELIQRLLYRLKPGGGDLEKVLALVGLYQALRPLYKHLKVVFVWAFTTKVTIPENDPVAKDILAWVGSNVILNSHSRSAMLVTGGMQGQDDDIYYHMARNRGLKLPVEKNNREVLSLPPIGTQLFWVGFRPFLFSRRGGHSTRNNGVTTGPDGQLQNSLVIMTLGWSLKPLRGFADLCHEFMNNNMIGTTTIYFADDNIQYPYAHEAAWQSISKAIRRLDTIDMDEATKLDVIRDAEYYYSEESRSYFADCGIPYRRGYLFYGPPGTGKSSFSAALAGHLGCDIYQINLASGTISDSGLQRLFLSLPKKCIVILEDIDSAGIGREQAPPEDTAQSMHAPKPDDFSEPSKWNNKKASGNSITLSGLLNAIDGNASQEGRLLIMTSNHPDALDEALTRPGRIDKKVYFGNMGTHAGVGIFKRLVGRAARVQDPTITTQQIEQWATEFADKVPANTFSPAQIQNFLQSCRGDARKALDEIGGWVAGNQPGGVSSGSGTGSEADTILVTSTDSST